MSKSAFSTIFKSTVAWEVRLLQQKLKSEGITAFVDDENITIAKPYLAHAIGGIGLRVYTEDAERAVAIIRKFQPSKMNPAACRATCPKCGNEVALRLKWPKEILFLAVLLLGIPFVLLTRLGCTKCEYIWWG
ncbi:DUF2007 domain-containing protein [Desulfovibrio sp. JC022]|uniref:putative signal transducing protein n=1 Tax=Desulfovibrio sp. JC022 TaxID=2593642 RepID=UPI0013D8CC61|nr:DUF2007 domain-containing protein [Desulfovibrio sp. JC022]NDV21885.1 DUF2007 domain-containing protein [Desulfovibrio sp. JC022]